MANKKSNNVFSYFRYYLQILGNHVYVHLFLSVLVSLLDGLGLAMFMPLIQSAAGIESNDLSTQSMGYLQVLADGIRSLGFEMNIFTVLVVLLILFIIKGLVRFAQVYHFVEMRQIFMKKIRYALINDVENIGYKGFLKIDSGRIQNNLTAETQRLFNSVMYYFSSVEFFVMLITYIVLAFLANWQFAFLVALGAFVSNFAYKSFNKSVKKSSTEVSYKGNDFNSFIIQALHNFKYLKATGLIHRYSEKLREVVDETEHLNKKMGIYSALILGIREPMMIVIMVAVILLQVVVFKGNLGAIILSLLLFYRSLQYLMAVQKDWNTFLQNSGSISSVQELQTEISSLQEADNKGVSPVFNAAITAENIHFSYDSDAIVNDISLQIHKNTSVALVGESGSGKTTLANILAGLIPVNQGSLKVDDFLYNEMNLRDFRSKVGYITQDAVVFNDTVFNNITFWDEPTAENLQRFEKALQLAHLKDFVQQLSHKEQTILGDNGILISGGQKQRISIARELYKQVEILILDEATSALDSETENVIQENIENLQGNYTLIIIAHRLSTIKHADMIYLMEKGKIIGKGNFNELMERSDKFKKMVALQEF